MSVTEDIRAICGSANVREAEPMKNHTTFRIGGPARLFVVPDSEEKIRDTVKCLREAGEDFYILGNGSNLLVSDKGYDGVIIQLYDSFNDIDITGNVITARAGALLTRVANKAASAGLTGLESASGIPGTIGGAIVMNAGAYGFEMKDVVTSVRVLNRQGATIDIPGADMEFGYRTSVCIKEGYVVLGATMKLCEGDETAIRERMKELKEQRTSKQPLEFPSAGSTFKRPEGYFAGKLIMDAGLRGYSVGGAQVSEKHCGFVINKGGATASDVRHLMKDVSDKVKEQFGVTLEPEVKMLGTFDD